MFDTIAFLPCFSTKSRLTRANDAHDYKRSRMNS